MGKKKKEKEWDTKLPTVTELLEPLATLDSVEAWSPTSGDHLHDITPQWCELVLQVKRDHDGELIIEVLTQVLRPDAHRNAAEAIWDELDTVVERIQRRIDRGKDPMRADVGQALGLATALAAIDNPLDPDVDEVRGVAMER